MALQTPQRSPGSPSSLGLDKNKKATYQNRSWVRGRDPEPAEDSPDGSDTGRPSLLSRLESPSLLKRIAPPPEAPAPPGPSLAERLKDAPAPRTEPVIDDYDEDVDMRDEVPVPPPPPAVPDEVPVKAEETTTIIPSPTRGRFGWRARGARPTIDVFGEPTEAAVASAPPQDIPKDHIEEEEEEEEDNSTPESTVSDAAVEAILADILPVNASPTVTPSQDARASQYPQAKEEPPSPDEDVKMLRHDSKPMQPIASPPPSSLPPSVLDKCRELLMPAMFQFAKRRNPSLNEEVAKKRLLARLSDDRCVEFVKLAQQMQTELQAQGGGEQSRTISLSRTSSILVLKRPREGDVVDDEQPMLKIPRTDSPGEMSSAEGVAHTALSRLPATTPRPCDGDPASLALEASSTAKPAVGVPQTSETPRASSPRRDDSPMSVTPLPSASILPVRHSSIQPLGEPSTEQNIPGSGDSRLHIPVTSECTVSAQPSSLPSPPISHSADPPAPYQHTRSPPPAETIATFSRLSLEPSHHGTRPVTVPSPTTTTQDIPVAQDTQDMAQDAIREKEDAQVHESELQPPTLVPALWSAVVGRPSAGVESVEFFVDDATAQATHNWARRKETFSFEHRHVQVHLLCLPAAAVSEVYRTLPPDATRGDIVTALWNIATEWPQTGTLVVQSDAPCPGNPWMPAPQSGPLDLTAAIARGANRFKLIQLADMSSRLFVFHATEPLEEERRAIGAKTLAWMQSLSRLAPLSPRSAQDRH